jgi:hypothetical protein
MGHYDNEVIAIIGQEAWDLILGETRKGTITAEKVRHFPLVG